MNDTSYGLLFLVEIPSNISRYKSNFAQKNPKVNFCYIIIIIYCLLSMFPICISAHFLRFFFMEMRRYKLNNIV